MKTVFVSGADRGVGFALCKLFLENKWIVYAGRFISYWSELDDLQLKCKDQLVLIPLDIGNDESVRAAVEKVKSTTPVIDMLVNCAGIYQDDSVKEMNRMFNINSLGAMRMTEAFLPMMQSGMKRLCYVSSEAGCISLSWRKEHMGYSMSKSALNMGVKLMFNELQPQGFTFRLYHPGHVKSYMLGDTKSEFGLYEPEDTASVAYQQFVADKQYEDILVMTDVENDIWPF